ncbi:isopentenyl-diphosphate Delta-isomerase [Intestinirhabdus alba]|jgi:isopentenyl-diphosphate delta-isomerase|uniref:Isopentenyl-diphosphate Delta-isomerase n=1 Tax=Intestinirhabdus alba TaxID=2899544 RepID=A0A6L6IH59_9ENTR|nr:isopentenyl-diphosphate Delta-isomerase [Intestinirhabdus alba]MTH45247.1 isopentenyl-diphosphate Delta-isomerase [Intestinirhabdus alba]
MSGEHVILLDDKNTPTGTLEKYAAHTRHTPLHLAFSCWLFNDRGQFLITRRSLAKKAWPGVWTNSVCGHPQQGESSAAAVVRRCRFELGVEIAGLTPVWADFRYRAVDPSGIVENEVCPVYAARMVGDLRPNAEEVMDSRWSELEEVLRGLEATPWAFSPWMVEQGSNALARSRLRDFCSR